jgi:hypothetical protein
MEPFDKRKHRRMHVTSTVEYVFSHSSQNDNYDGVVADVSESGLCLFTAEPLSKGQAIIIQNHILAAPRTATVRWSEKFNNLYYKAGVEFERPVARDR